MFQPASGGRHPGPRSPTETGTGAIGRDPDHTNLYIFQVFFVRRTSLYIQQKSEHVCLFKICVIMYGKHVRKKLHFCIAP